MNFVHLPSLEELPAIVAEAKQVRRDMSDGGLDGIALSFDDYDDGIAAYDEAIRPLLVEAGLRTV